MIDKLFLYNSNIENTNLLNYELISNSNKEYLQAKHKNLIIRQNENSITISGSLTKSKKGDNIQNCTYNECLEEIDNIAAETGLNIMDFDVFTYELGANFNMRLAPSFYIDAMLKPTIYSQRPYSTKKGLTGVVFGLGGTTKKNKEYLQMVCYDKIAESKFNNINLSPEQMNSNLLRCEFKRLSNIKTKLNLKERLKVKDFFSQRTKNLLINDYSRQFDKIEVLDAFEFPEFKTYKEFKELIFCINTNDTKKLLDAIESYFNKYGVTPNERTKIRKAIKERGKGFEVKNGSIAEELKSKINERINKELTEKI